MSRQQRRLTPAARLHCQPGERGASAFRSSLRLLIRRNECSLALWLGRPEAGFARSPELALERIAGAVKIPP
jgi:hypothetical protein